MHACIFCRWNTIRCSTKKYCFCRHYTFGAYIVYQNHGNSVSFASSEISNNQPIPIILHNNHFTAVLKRNTAYNLQLINNNLNQFQRFILKECLYP